MKLVAIFAALVAVSTTQMDSLNNQASSGATAAQPARVHVLTLDSTMIPKCFPHCGDGGY